MVDAPERIWLHPAAMTLYVMPPETNTLVQYVRADLYARLQEQLEAVTRERTVSINDPREVEEANIRADLAIDRMHKAEARAARLEAALLRISDMCPATQEMTVAHMMADEAEAALDVKGAG